MGWSNSLPDRIFRAMTETAIPSPVKTAQTTTFAVLFALMSKVFIPRVGGAMIEREGRISGDIAQARGLKQQAARGNIADAYVHWPTARTPAGAQENLPPRLARLEPSGAVQHSSSPIHSRFIAVAKRNALRCL